MIVSGKHSFCANLLRNVFYYRPGYAQSVVRACTPAHFVQNKQAVARCILQDRRDFYHFNHKSRLVVNQIIACAHPCKYPVNYGNLRGLCRNKATEVRHYGYYGVLTHIRALARHIGTCYNQSPVFILVKAGVVCNKLVLCNHFNHGVPAFLNEHWHRAVYHSRTNVSVALGNFRKRGKNIKFCNVFGNGFNRVNRRGELVCKFLIQSRFKAQSPVFA